jgi:hypothetical protein
MSGWWLSKRYTTLLRPNKRTVKGLLESTFGEARLAQRTWTQHKAIHITFPRPHWHLVCARDGTYDMHLPWDFCVLVTIGTSVLPE